MEQCEILKEEEDKYHKIFINILIILYQIKKKKKRLYKKT